MDWFTLFLRECLSIVHGHTTNPGWFSFLSNLIATVRSHWNLPNSAPSQRVHQIFMLLNLNAVMSIIANVPAAIVSTVCCLFSRPLLMLHLTSFTRSLHAVLCGGSPILPLTALRCYRSSCQWMNFPFTNKTLGQTDFLPWPFVPVLLVYVRTSLQAMPRRNVFMSVKLSPLKKINFL